MVSNDWLNPWFKIKYNKKEPVKIDKPIRKTLSKTKNGSILNFHDYLEGIGSHKEVIPIMEKVLPKLARNKRSHYKLEDFKRKYAEHPEWHGMNRKQLAKDTKYGGSGFYYALAKFDRKNPEL